LTTLQTTGPQKKRGGGYGTIQKPEKKTRFQKRHNGKTPGGVGKKQAGVRRPTSSQKKNAEKKRFPSMAWGGVHVPKPPRKPQTTDQWGPLLIKEKVGKPVTKRFWGL